MPERKYWYRKWCRAANLKQFLTFPEGTRIEFAHDNGTLDWYYRDDDTANMWVSIYSKHGKFPRLKAGHYLTTRNGKLVAINVQPQHPDGEIGKGRSATGHPLNIRVKAVTRTI